MSRKAIDKTDLAVTTFRFPKPILKALKLKSMELTEKRGHHVPVNEVVLMCIKRAGIEGVE